MGNPANILFVGAKADDRRLKILEAAGYICASDPAATDILASINQHKPGVVLISIAGSRGVDAIAEVKADANAGRVTVAAIDIGDTPGILRACRDAGADDVFEDDTDALVLVARMRALVRLGGMEAELVRRSKTAAEFGVTISTDIARAEDARGGQLLVVGAENGKLEMLCPLLSKSGINFTTEPDPYRARSRVEGSENETFDGALVYVDDDDMREKCDYFCRAVRNDRRLYDLPLFLVAEHGVFPDHVAAYAEGANVAAEAPVDCDFVDNHLHMLLRGRERRRAIGQRIAATLEPKTIDNLGSIYSADFICSHLERLGRDKADRGTVSSAILFFVPTVGEVAALYGMEEAALLRRQLANWLAALVRVEDMIAHTGTDEFLALLPETGLTEAKLVRDRTIGVLHESEFRLTDNVPVGIEVYVQSGITELRAGDKLEGVIARASDLLN